MNTAGDDKQRQQKDDERHVVEEDLVLQLVHHSAHNQAYRYRYAEEEGNNEFVGVLLTNCSIAFELMKMNIIGLCLV